MSMLDVAGVLAILSAIGHGFLGDRKLRAQPIEPESFKSFTRCCYQFGSAGWLAGGVLLLAADSFSDTGRMWLAIGLAPLFAFGALVNLWFTKGRHGGWVMLAAVSALSVLG